MNNFPILHTERLDLIEIEQKHLGDIYKLFSDEGVTQFHNLLPFKDEQEGQTLLDWFRSRFEEYSGIRWGIALKNKPTIKGLRRK
jgi:ribosomal-protein-alanine N-acetyltransferase